MQNSIDRLNKGKLQPKLRLTPQKKKALLKKEEVVSDQVSLGSGLKQARPGSDMAQMVQDLKDNGVLAEAKQEKPPLRTPRPGSDMAQMLEDIQNPTGQQRIITGDNGVTLTVLEDVSSVPDPPEKPLQPKATSKSEKPEEGQAVGAVQTAQDMNDLADGLLQSASPAQEITGSVSEAIATTGADTTEASAPTLEALLQTQGGEATQSTAEMASEGLSTAAPELNQGLQVGMLAAAGASLVLAPFLLVGGVKKFITGRKQRKVAALTTKLAGRAKERTQSPEVRELAESALKRAEITKSEGTDNLLKGTGTTLMGARSLLAAATTSGLVTGTQLVGPAISGALLAGSGVVAGGIDVVLGVRDIARGKTLKGSLGIGFGVAVGAVALGAGVPALIATGALLLGKIGVGLKERKEAKKAAEAAQQAKLSSA